MRRLYFCASSLSALALTWVSAPVCAATASDTNASSPTGLTEVVVTARRRAESAQRVPTTILALSHDTLVQRGIHNEADLQLAVPGLVAVTQDSSNKFTFVIRGESQDAYSGTAPGVQPYINEIPITATTPSVIYDMQNVQVLKGPQGTLFGRNSTGGAVLYTTTQPGAEYGGYASIQYGNLQQLITEAAIDLPIVKDKVLLRLAANYQQGGAYVYNIYNNRYLGDKSGGSYRATMLLKPTDNLTNTTTVQFTNLYGATQPGTSFYTVPCGQPEGGTTCLYEPSNPTFEALIHPAPGQSLFTTGEPYPNGYIYPGGFASLPAFLKSRGNYVVDLDGNFGYRGVAAFVGNTTSYNITPDLLVKNAFGFQRTSLHSSVGGSDGYSPYALQETGGHEPGGSNVDMPVDTVISDEIQLQGKAFDNRLNYIVGFFFNDEKDNFNSPLTGVAIFGSGPPVLGMTYAPYAVRYAQLFEDRSLAGFAQATYAVTDKLNITGGVRYTADQLSSMQQPGGFYYNFEGLCPASPLCNTGGSELQKTTNTNPSWTVSLDYHVTPDWMLYVAQRGSWRVGGYAPAQEPGGNTFASAVGGNYFLPETIKDVEVGSKYGGHIGAVPVRFNIDFFNAWIDNVQKGLAVTINGTHSLATINVPKSNIMGVEADFEVRPASWLRLGGNGAWTDAEFLTRETLLLGHEAVLGDFADAPKYTGALYGDIYLPLQGTAGKLDFHADLYYQSGMYVSSVSPTLTPNSELPPYAVANLRVDWANPLGARGVTLSAFVKNVGDKLYYTGGGADALSESVEAANYGAPRTYGAILRYEF